MNPKDEYELKFWETQRSYDLTQRYLKQIALFEINRDMGDTLEIGTGPRGGILPYITARRKVALEPLYSQFKDRGLLENHAIEYVEQTIENNTLTDTFDTIISANSLDHGESDFTSISCIAKLLKPTGSFYLQVHLRTPEQLNVGHDHYMDINVYEDELKKNNLVEIWRNTYRTDPTLDGDYKTMFSLIGYEN